MAKNDRKLILVRSDLLENAMRITAKEGKTMFAFTNEIFGRAIEAYQEHITLAEVLESYKMIQTSKSLECVVVPFDVVNYMTKELYRTGKEKLLDQWYESGVWNGSYLNMKFQEEDKLEVARRFIKANLWNLDEFIVKSTKEGIAVKCFSPSLNMECAQMLARFLQGIFNSLGYTVKSNKCLRGIVILKLEATRKETSPQDNESLESEKLYCES